MVDDLINHILDRTNADEFEVFLSEQGNYRPYVASVKKYKGTREGSEKPIWFGHIRRYLYEHWNATAVYGCEADDMLSIRQRDYIRKGMESCIASRDKDLLITPGWHYAWKCGELQPEKPLHFVEALGELWPRWKTLKSGKQSVKDLKGTGLSFFYSQLITGDVADNYPGAPRKGANYAYEALKDCSTEEELYEVVLRAYIEAYKGEWVQYVDWRGKPRRKHVSDMLREQGILAWMCEYEGQRWLPPHRREHEASTSEERNHLSL